MTEQEQIEQSTFCPRNGNSDFGSYGRSLTHVDLRENGINVIDFAYVDRSPPKKRSKKSSAKGSHPKDTSAVRDTPSPSASSDTTDGSKQGKLMNLRYRHPAPPMGMEYTLADRPKLPRECHDLGQVGGRLTGDTGEPSPATIAEEIRKFRLAHKNVSSPTRTGHCACPDR